MSVHEEEMIKFWKSSASGSGSKNFKRILQQYETGHFTHKLAYVSGGSDRIFMKIISHVYPWTMKSPLNFGSNPESGSIFSLADVYGL